MIIYRLTTNQLMNDRLAPLLIVISDSYTQMVGPLLLVTAHWLLSATHKKARTEAG